MCKRASAAALEVSSIGLGSDGHRLAVLLLLRLSLFCFLLQFQFLRFQLFHLPFQGLHFLLLGQCQRLILTRRRAV